MDSSRHIDADQRMDPNAPTVKDRFIGCLLGMGIGDALSLPTRGLSGEEIQSRFGRIETYQPLRDEQGEVRVPAGQFTDNAELSLCLAESLVTSNGFLDPDTAGYRFQQVLSSDYNYLLGETTRRALEHAAETGEYQSGVGGEGTAGAGPAARVAPIALVHALGNFNAEVFVREVMRSSLITHAHPESVNGAIAVAYALRLIVRRELPPEMLIPEVLAFIDEDEVAKRLRKAGRLLEAGADPDAALAEIGTSGYVAEAVAAGLYLFSVYPDDFEAAVLTAVNTGGATSAVASITGALCGAWTGAEQLPAGLIDGLDGRMYILMAAPTVLRVAQLRAGLYLQLHQR
jgi:ADP-ribosyl-[dinitrogen reductase] hydrolase